MITLREADGYFATAEGLWQKGRRGAIRLTNCDVEIVSAVARGGDGAERRVVYVVEARRSGQVCRFEVGHKDIDRLSKVLSLSGLPGAAVVPGRGRHAAFAMHLLSTNTRSVRLYPHLGWEEVDGQWLYLHGEGAVGPAGLLEDVKGEMPAGGYSLPSPPKDAELSEAVQACTAALGADPGTVTALFGAAFRVVLPGLAPANIHLKGGAPADRARVARLALSFFGPGAQPLDWGMRPRVLEEAFAAGAGTLVVVGDAPEGVKARPEAFRLFRAASDHTARDRCRSNGTLVPGRPLQALVVSVGDEMPGEGLASQRARALLVELATGGHGLAEALGQAEAAASSGLFARAMAAYVAWLAKEVAERGMDDVRAAVSQAEAELGGQFSDRAAHPRTAPSVAALAAGWAYWTTFCREAGVLAPERSQEALDCALGYLRALASAQKAWVGADPA